MFLSFVHVLLSLAASSGELVKKYVGSFARPGYPVGPVHHMGRCVHRCEKFLQIRDIVLDWGGVHGLAPGPSRELGSRRLAGAAAGGSPPTIDQLLFFSGAVGWSKTHRAGAGRLAFVCVGHAPRGPDEASLGSDGQSPVHSGSTHVHPCAFTYMDTKEK